MSDDNTTENDEVEQTTITPNLVLDDAHAEMVAQLREAGVNVESYLTQRLQPVADEAIHELFTQSKYQGGE
jgi:metallophosphoesterase superfamily enzyme